MILPLDIRTILNKKSQESQNDMKLRIVTNGIKFRIEQEIDYLSEGYTVEQKLKRNGLFSYILEDYNKPFAKQKTRKYFLGEDGHEHISSLDFNFLKLVPCKMLEFNSKSAALKWIKDKWGSEGLESVAEEWVVC